MKLFPLLLAPLLLALPAQAATPTKTAPTKPGAAAPAQPADPVAALLEQSRDAQSKGEAGLAQRLAQAAIVADPARPAAYVALGDLYAAAGQSEFARSYYAAALEIDPADLGASRAIAALGNARATAANSP
jgi:tetratricopeptide (TPR) repeat protein